MASDPSRILDVLLILENAGAGSGRHVVDLARGLHRRGHGVTLLYSDSRLEPWFEKELDALPGIKRALMPMSPGLGPADVFTIRAVRAFIRDNGPFDVIHGHSSKAGALARLGGWKTPGIKVYTPHAFYTLGAPPGSVKGGFYASLERILARLCEGIVCVSAAEHRHAQSRLGLPQRKLFTVPNGLDPLPPGDRAQSRAQLGMKDDHFCVGFVGRLARQKAVHRLIDAFAVAHRTHAYARLVIVGDGPDADRLKSRAEGLGLHNAVVWTGAADGIHMMTGFDLFALPSLYEAFPYVLLEAMNRELPILSTRVGGVDELVQEGVNGRIVEQDDADTFGQHLTDMISDRAACQRMGEASNRIVKSFDIDAMVEATLKVYKDLVSAVGA